MLYYILFSIFIFIFISVMFPNSKKIGIKYILEPLLMDCDSGRSSYDNALIQPFSNSLITFGYYCVYLYSCLQIKYYKTSIIVLPYITKLNNILMYYIWTNQSNDNNLSIIYFYNNNLFITESLIEINNNIDAFNIMTPLTFDYIICMDRTIVSPVNIICYNRVPNNLLYELSNVRFLSITIVCYNKTYNVVLNTDNYNYYVINNTIDELFIKYYLTYVLNETISFEDFKYCLEILDSDINIHNLNETHQIIIKKDTYEITPTEKKQCL